jgi:hypothetical protein
MIIGSAIDMHRELKKAGLIYLDTLADYEGYEQ